MAWEPIIAIGVVSLVTGFILTRPKYTATPIKLRMTVEISDEVKERIRTLLNEHRKIEAIKVLREATGLGLKGAKDIVDAMANGTPLTQLVGSGNSSTSVDPSLSDRSSAGVDAKVQMLVDQGRKIDAIRELRQQTGLDLKHAKDIVDSMTAGVQFDSTILANSTPASVAASSQTGTGSAIDEVKRLIRAGKKHEAVQLYQQSSGLGLSRAKEEVDQIAKDLR